jgi:hypothetical protein
MILLTSYEISTQGKADLFKIFFQYVGAEPAKIRISVWDRVFKTTEYSSVELDAAPAGNYWAEFRSDSHIVNQESQLTTKFNFGVELRVTDVISNACQTVDVPVLMTDIKSRKPGFPNVWILGDSNVAYLFKNKEAESSQFNGVSHLSLSMNRFSKSVTSDFYRSIPFIENDLALFLLGEIDIRTSIIRNSRLKNESIEDNVCRIFDRFMDRFSEFTDLYPGLGIAVLMPPPPFRDSVKLGEELVSGSEDERMLAYKTLKSMLQYSLGSRLIDCYLDYLDEAGFVKPEFLNPGDHHILDSKPFFTSLTKKIKDYEINLG